MIPRDVQSWILEQARLLKYTSPQVVFLEIVSVLDEYEWLRPKTAYFRGEVLLCVFDNTAEVAIPIAYPAKGAFVSNLPGDAPLKDLVAKTFSRKRATPQFTPAGTSSGTPYGTPIGTPRETPGVTPPPVPRKNPLAPQIPQKPPKEVPTSIPPVSAPPPPTYKPAPPVPPLKHAPNPSPSPGVPEQYKPLPPRPLFPNAESLPYSHPHTFPAHPVNLSNLQVSDVPPHTIPPQPVAPQKPVAPQEPVPQKAAPQKAAPQKSTPLVDLMNDSIEPKQLPIDNLINKLQEIPLDYGDVAPQEAALDSMKSQLDKYESELLAQKQTHQANLRGLRESTLKARKLIEKAPKEEIDMSSIEGIQQVLYIPDISRETAIASDNGIQNLLDILPKALDSGSVSFEVYMRLVRQFAREQFTERLKWIPSRPPKA